MNYFSQKLTLKDSGITWIREIPKHWNVGILNNLVQIIVSNVDKKSNEAEIKVLLCNYTDVYYNRFINLTIDFMEATATKPEVEKFSLEINDVLITKDSETPDDIAVPSLIIEKIPNLLCGYHLSILRPLMDRLDGKYLLFSIISTSIKSQFSSLATGITRYGLSYKHIKSINLCVPPLEEQRAIASFLDRKTAAIATLIAKKQRLIQILEEKRTVLINQTVTKGLNPNVPIKNSGIPWIGEVPKHWDVTKLKWVSPYISVGIVITPAKYYVDNGIPCLRSLNIKSGQILGENFVYISEESNELLSKSKIFKGDLVCVRTGQTGTTAMVDERFDGVNCIDLIIIRKSLKASSEYLSLIMNSEVCRSQYSIGSSGAIQQHFNVETATNLIVCNPPLDEQLQIIEHCHLLIKRHNSLIQKVSEQIEKLQEYRQSLITAAVTGKIHISEEVAA